MKKFKGQNLYNNYGEKMEANLNEMSSIIKKHRLTIGVTSLKILKLYHTYLIYHLDRVEVVLGSQFNAHMLALLTGY